jgi:hypothetical protein
MRPRALFLLACLACVLLVTVSADTQNHQWDTDLGGTGDWMDAGHWIPKDHVPGAAFPSETFVTIASPKDGLSNSSVALASPITINSLTIGPRISPLPVGLVPENRLGVGSALTFSKSDANPYPTVSNSGVIIVTGSLRTMDTVLLEGPGRVALRGGAMSGSFVNEHLVEGEGYIESGSITNRGTIRAAEGKVLSVTASVTNEGAGTLTTDGYSDGFATSTLRLYTPVDGGRIDANNALVQLWTTVKNLTLAGGNMVFTDNTATVSGTVTADADAVLSATTVGTLQLEHLSTLVNNGVIRLVSAAYGTRLSVPDRNTQAGFGSDATLGGAGRLELAGGAIWLGPLSSLVNDANHRIEGVGNLAGPGSSGHLYNKGRITASGGTLSLAQIVANTGVLEASANSTLELGLYGEVFNSGNGVISPNGGTIRMNASEVTNGEWLPGAITLGGSLLGRNHFASGAVVSCTACNVFLPEADVVANDTTITLTGAAGIMSGSTASPTTAGTFSGPGTLALVAVGASVPTFRGSSTTNLYINDTAHTIRGACLVSAPIENRGRLVAENGTLRNDKAITGAGTVLVKDTGTLDQRADIQARDLRLDVGSTLKTSVGKITLSGDFSFNQTVEAKWPYGFGWLIMSGGQAIQALEVGGSDVGLSATGGYQNFGVSNLKVEGAGTRVSLVDLVDNGNRAALGHEVLYVYSLSVNPGATLNLNGLRLYADIGPENTPHRVVAGEGSLFGGGTIVDETGTPAPTFTDNPLQAGTTAVKAVHVTELRAAIDTLRTRYNLGVFAWTDGALSTATPIRVLHITELRAALDQAYAAASRTPPSYTDAPPVTATTPVKAIHITEIRAAVLALW